MRNAFSGYTYQQQVILLFLSIMDVEREILKLDIEAKTNDNFEDLIIFNESERFQLQIKDFDDVSIKDLKVENNKIFIKGKSHKLSQNQNIIFFKYIDFRANEKFLYFPSYRLNNNVSIISLSRVQIDKKIGKLYKNNPQRQNEIDSFFNSILDRRIWSIPLESLPQIKIFLTKLQEKSVSISHKLLEFENILLLEGKPGVGKSHFVNTLSKEYKTDLIYRFWIGNQDRDYQDRLKYENFIRDLNAKLFHDQKIRKVEELLNKLKQENRTFIIDGLDHVENYNKPDFNSFIKFINNAKNYCKIIILSRPLIANLSWKKHILENWNLKQTEKVLETLFHLSDYATVHQIYEISQGYPIIVKYLAEHYKIHHAIPEIEQVNNIDTYYQKIIANEKGKHSLSLFLCCSSYIMESEIELFMGDEKDYIKEFIQEHPYLFDIKLNRIALFHDSFNTFLRKQVNYETKAIKVGRIVSESILKLEKRFLSRFSFFPLTKEQKIAILIKYASIKTFESILKNTIDYEAIRAFYKQIREILTEFSPNELNVNNYYDLSLIDNLIVRDHLSTINTFYYTYVQSLLYNGITDEDITSSDFLFGMYYYVRTKNATLLLNRTANDHYGVDNFHRDLEYDISEEVDYIEKHSEKLNKRIIDKILKDEINLRKNITYIIENMFIHNSKIKGYEPLKSSFNEYLNGNTYSATKELRGFLTQYKGNDYYPEWILKEVFNNLISYGWRIDNLKNEYQDLTLKGLIHKYRSLGSFTLRDKIHNYIRLALLENRKIDIKNIYPYWTKYYQRKDISLLSLPIALKTLENDNLISLKDCVYLIDEVQEVSERGYRGLLAEFIELYLPTKIIPFLEKNFNVDNLRVEWFKLFPKYINQLSEHTYKIEENKIFNYHRSFSIPFEEIENALASNKAEKLISSIKFLKTKISFKQSQRKAVLQYEKFNLRFEEWKEQHDYDKYKENSLQRFERGILSSQDLKFIKKKNLSPTEIAKYSNGNYTSLSEIEIFKIYKPEEIQKNFKSILYNSMTTKTHNINYFYSLCLHPGNILAMIKLYRNDKEFKFAVKSFEKYLSLSMFDFTLEWDNSIK